MIWGPPRFGLCTVVSFRPWVSSSGTIKLGSRVGKVSAATDWVLTQVHLVVNVLWSLPCIYLGVLGVNRLYW
jgi:hypothetical protein